MEYSWLGQDIERELGDGQFPSVLVERLGTPTRTLARGHFTTSLVTLSPLVRGHVVVFANTEHRSFSALARDCREAVIEAEDVVANHRACFGPSIVFEHGMNACGSAACGVTRAHFHLVPGPDVDALIKSLTAELGEPDTRADQLWRAENADGEYIAIGRSLGDGAVWAGRLFPSQIVRRHVARMLGLIEWDWKALFGWADMRTTVMSWQNRS